MVLEDEHVAAMEQSVDDLYLWGTSFPYGSLESTLERLDYLKDCILDAFCRITELMTNHGK